MTVTFAAHLSVPEVEEGHAHAPHFAADVLMPCVTTDAADGTVLMLGWCVEARQTIEVHRHCGDCAGDTV